MLSSLHLWKFDDGLTNLQLYSDYWESIACFFFGQVQCAIVKCPEELHLLSASQHHESFLLILKIWRLRLQIFVQSFTQIVLGGLLYKFRQAVSRAGKGGWELWQVVTAIHDGSDGLMLCEWHSWGCYDHSFCASFLSLELTPKVIFKVFTAIS